MEEKKNRRESKRIEDLADQKDRIWTTNLGPRVISEKKKGATLDKIFWDTSYPLFAHGAAYVILGRVRSHSDVAFCGDPPAEIENVVWEELLTGHMGGESSSP